MLSYPPIYIALATPYTSGVAFPLLTGAAEGSSDSQTEGHCGGTLLPTENG